MEVAPIRKIMSRVSGTHPKNRNSFEALNSSEIDIMGRKEITSAPRQAYKTLWEKVSENEGCF
jgi:hypothetical protein